MRPEVESDVVEVLGRWSVRSRGGGKDWTYGIWVCNGGWEDDGLEDCVIRKIDANELCSAIRCQYVGPRRSRRSPRI